MFDADYGGWPIVRLRAFSFAMDGEIQRDLEDIRSEVCSHGTACAMLFNLSDCKSLSSTDRIALGSNLLELDSREFISACAMVFDPKVLPGMLVDAFGGHRPRFPIRRFDSVVQAEEWLHVLTTQADGPAANDVPMLDLPPVTREQDHSDGVSPMLRHPMFEDEFERMPTDGSWIVHFDAKRNRDVVVELADELRSNDLDVFLCERQVSADMTLWLGWTGPFRSPNEAFELRDKLATRGVILTVSQWTARSA